MQIHGRIERIFRFIASNGHQYANSAKLFRYSHRVLLLLLPRHTRNQWQLDQRCKMDRPWIKWHLCEGADADPGQMWDL